MITSRRDDLHAVRPALHDDLGAAFADPCAVLAVVIAELHAQSLCLCWIGRDQCGSRDRNRCRRQPTKQP